MDVTLGFVNAIHQEDLEGISLHPAHDLVRIWWSKVKGKGHRDLTTHIFNSKDLSPFYTYTQRGEAVDHRHNKAVFRHDLYG